MSFESSSPGAALLDRRGELSPNGRLHADLDDAPAPGALRLDLLQAFVVLADELHFTHAAKRLFMSQSGLSRRIRQIERVLGTELVQRTTRSVELTPAGVALLPHARALLSAGRSAAAATRAASAPS